MEAFNLEEEVDGCNDTCVDWVKITYKNMGEEKKFCGSAYGELNTVHMDGENELTLEFFTNRRIQDSGFSYYVQCINESVMENVIDSAQVQGSEPCMQPGPRPIFALVK